MKSIVEVMDQASHIGAALALAGSNAVTSNEMALASGTVIALRTALGAQGMADPLNADHAELGRILPEKFEAVAAAATVMLERSADAAQQMTAFAMNEAMLAGRATMALATCADPAALANAQGSFAMAWFGRMMAQSIALGTMAMRSQEAAMRPFHRAATANAKRLGR